MGIADEIRARQQREAADKQHTAELLDQGRVTNWSETKKVLDSIAPEVVQACKELGIPTTGGLFSRGWVFELASARYTPQ